MGIFDADPLNPSNTLPGVLAVDGQPLIPSNNNIIPEATPFNDGLMSGSQAGQLNQANTFGAIQLWVSTTGSDSNPGTQSQPFLTIEKAVASIGSHGNSFLINVMPGTYLLTQTDYFLSRGYGPNAVPVIFLGGFNNVYGNRINTALSSTGTRFTDSTLTGVRQATGASIIAGAPAGAMRVLVAGYGPADVKKQVNIGGAINPGNNMTGQIFAVNPGVSIDVVNAQAVAPDAGPLTVTDSLEGAFIECMSGANVGQRRMIRQNTTTTFDVNTPFSGAIAVGDIYAIETPNVILQANSHLTEFYGSAMGFTGIKFQAIGTGSTAFEMVGDFIDVEGCEVDLATDVANNFGGFNIFLGSSFLNSAKFTTPNNRTFLNDPFNIFTPLHNGSGIFIHNGNMSVNQNGTIQGYYVLRSMAVNAIGGGIGMSNVDAARTTFLLNQGGSIQFAADVSTYPGRVNARLSGVGALITATNSRVTLDGVDLSNSSSDALLLVTSQGALNRVTGTGNAGVGIHVDRSSYCRIDNGAVGGTTVTGTLGDTSFGHASPANIQPYATIRSVDPNGQPADGVKGFQDFYLNRIEP